MYFLPGNHDDSAAMDRTLFRDSRRSIVRGPSDPLNGWFEHGGVRFVFVDWGRRAKAISTPGMFDLLAAAVEPGKPTVVLTHHHVAPCGAAWLDEFIADDVYRFWDALRGKQVLGVLGGHIHMTTETVVGGIPVLTLRSTCFQFARQARPLLTLEPPQYRIVTIDGGKLTSEVVEVPLGRIRF